METRKKEGDWTVLDDEREKESQEDDIAVQRQEKMRTYY